MQWNIFIIMLAYNVGDVYGRFLLARLKFIYPRAILTAISLLRCVFILTSFLILFKNTPFWNSSFTIISNVLLIGITNGFFGVAACESVPRRLDPHEKEFGGYMINLVMMGGVSFGYLISWYCFGGLVSK